MAYMSVEEWRKKKDTEDKQGTSKSSATSTSSKTSSTASNKTSSTTGEKSSKSSGYMSVSEWRAQKANKSVQDWANAANSILNDTKKYHSKWHSKDDEAYTSIYDRTSTILAQADNWRKQYAGNKEAIDSINSIVQALSDARTQSWKTRDFYSQWKTEDDYNKYWAQLKDYEEKKNFDIDAGQKEIDALKKKRSEIMRSKMSPGSTYLTGGSTLNSSP